MCDYSLHGVKNRLAVEGESLFVHKFPGGSKGLASEAGREAVKYRGLKKLAAWLWPGFDDPLKNLPAVCVPPGARLYLEGIPKTLQEKYGVGEAAEVTFTQCTYEPFRYRDAFRFANGVEAIIQKFPDGVRVEVLALALEEEAGAVIPADHQAERSMSANA